MKKYVFFLAMVLSSLMVRAQDYDRAIGLRLGWDYGVSYKQFLNKEAAFEGIVHFRSYGNAFYSWNYMRVTGLYLIHKELPGIEGLYWYYGGGGSLSFWGGEYDDFVRSRNKKSGRLGVGLHGALGLDYKFKDIPIQVTLDWIPSIMIGTYYSGFVPDYGGMAVRYTF